MKVLIIGSGGREHALGRKLSQAPNRPTLIFAPGNPGMADLGKCFPVAADDISGLLVLAKSQNADLTIVGPETPLVNGIVDLFHANGLKIFGPTAAAARLEGSKAFSKDFMARHGIPTAAFGTFTALEPALGFLKQTGAPVVVKASGLCAGKGAVVCQSMEEAEAAVHSMLGTDAVFGEAGREVVIEEFMPGEEASVFAVCDGANFALLPTAQDHKRAFDGDQGPNTGGMGAYAPAPLMTDALLEEVCQRIIAPTLTGMRSEGTPYFGFLYVGIMVTPNGPKVVEFNCRLGDPETQVILSVFDGDLLEIILTACIGKLPYPINLPKTKGHAAVVVLASGGYPGNYTISHPIWGLESAGGPSSHVIHAGTKVGIEYTVTDGGRVLGIVGEGSSLFEAVKNAYEDVKKIRFHGIQYRTDIGFKGLQKVNQALV